MKLSEIVSGYIERLPAGIVIGEPEVERNLRNAVRFYCGYAALTNMPPAGDDVHSAFGIGNDNSGGQDVVLTLSEWAIIRPLFELYVEKENAIHLEASRGLGVDVYGRSASEVQNDITQIEAIMAEKAFFEPVETV